MDRQRPFRSQELVSSLQVVYHNGGGNASPERVSNAVYVSTRDAQLKYLLYRTFASSAPEGITDALEAHFTFSDEVSDLLISLFVAGYCVGPLVWGPASESVCIATFYYPYDYLLIACITVRQTSGFFARISWIYRISSRMCIVTKHGLYPYLSIFGRYIRCCTTVEQRVS